VKLILRRVDYLGDEADALNAMIEALAVRASAREAALARCHELASDLASAGSPEQRRLAGELQEALKRVR
jgi:hypothetical protein